MNEPAPRNPAKIVVFTVIGIVVMGTLLGVAVVGASAFLLFLLS